MAFNIVWIWIILLLFSHPSQWILAAKNRFDVTGKIITIKVFWKYNINFIFIPFYGFNRAAFASMISFIIIKVLFLNKRELQRLNFQKNSIK